MKTSAWHRESCDPGRAYMLPKHIYRKYEEQQEIQLKIKEHICENVHIDAAVRITTESPISDQERLITAIPYDNHYDKLMDNVSELMFKTLTGYYISAEPHTHHFGISNFLLEGNTSSFLFREMEKIFHQIKNREDIAGRFTKDVKYEVKNAGNTGENYLRDTLIKGLDITLGFRVVTLGSKVNADSIFIPTNEGDEVIEQIYYNLEQILMQNFATYDENTDRDYLQVTDTLIFKELCSVLRRAKLKENTRKKILNKLVVPTSLTDNFAEQHGALIGDTIYDTINHVQDQMVRRASDRSRELYNAFMIRATEITDDSVDWQKLSFSQVTTPKIQVPTSKRAEAQQRRATPKPVEAPKRPAMVDDFEEL